jgi:hypothetical protein
MNILCEFGTAISKRYSPIFTLSRFLLIETTETEKNKKKGTFIY